MYGTLQCLRNQLNYDLHVLGNLKIDFHAISPCESINAYQKSCNFFPTDYECIDESSVDPEIQGKSRMMSSQAQGSQVANPRNRRANPCIGRQIPQKVGLPATVSASESAPIRLSSTPSETSEYDEGTSWCPPSYDKPNPTTMEAYYEKLNPATVE